MCDDGNRNDHDGCRNDCVKSACGDGVIEIGVEECDDGNRIDADGCLNTCIQARCGDGVIRAGIEAHDGNLDDNDACTTT